MNFEKIAEQCLQERAERVPHWIERFKKMKSTEELHDFLSRPFIGLRRIGKGNYSYAIKGGGNDYILKYSKPGVFVDPSADFLHDVWKTKIYEGNPIFPRIQKDHLILYPDQSYAVFMEYLDLDNTNPDGDLFMAFKMKGLRVIRPGGQYRAGFMLVATMQKCFRECMSPEPHKPYTDAVCMAFNFKRAQLEQYMKFCSKYVDDQVDIDLHSGNMGARPNGQMVLFDPLGHVQKIADNVDFPDAK
jgi:hypothetical protein